MDDGRVADDDDGGEPKQDGRRGDEPIGRRQSQTPTPPLTTAANYSR